MSSILTGERLRVSVFGESHGPAIGAVADGLPEGETLDFERLAAFMARRAPGGALSTPRREADAVRVLSGVKDGVTTGAPLGVLIENTNARSGDYEKLKRVPRPSHADYPALLRYHGHADPAGGGHFSGRLTAPLCAVGGLCLQMLSRRGVTVGAHLQEVAGIADAPVDSLKLTPEALAAVAQSPFPVFDADAGARMRAAIGSARAEGDSVGGVVELFALGLPGGLGDPMFGGVENRLATALFGIPAVRGVSFGEGFAAARMRGSAHNDAYCLEDGRVRTRTNHHGGVLGGITTGAPLVARMAVKPTPSIAAAQRTLDLGAMEETTLTIGGRHDPCIAHRAVPVMEAVAAIVLLDLLLQGPETDSNNQKREPERDGGNDHGITDASHAH